MNILIYCPTFDIIGGLEMVIAILADQFVKSGHQVKIVAQTTATEATAFPFEVIRQPSRAKLLQLVQWCDIYFQGNVSLKGIWPLLWVRKPLVLTHQSWYQRLDGRQGWQDRLKLSVTRRAINISASQSIASHLPVSSAVIPNPYREDIFYEMPEIPRNRELVFLGRLVSDKGVDLLLEALGSLQKEGLTPHLTIIGTGPEEANLRQQVSALNLENQVEFAGTKRDRELATLLNQHQILVVSSRWSEPFGIVALEGIACGCVAIGSNQGGLPDAIGKCGVTFPNGDSQALATLLKELLQNPSQLEGYRQSAIAHLAKHTRSAVSQAYLETINQHL
ncbi:glycosyltransferase family 4 protein [Desertifilum tharense]|uniref:Glycosyl transferase family 1 n=1 Tax=Desertifilum tharense IPPAS B-1220 TaxID=1781255 RepID=A0A1E5QMR7_9CYAN|nr:glycosyltransferase family 4 protein [Desertifilum tharense]MDA0208793.1 glycosyltransferase family 4 protein [Cyanobacteria bacterium FC1]OEJ75940.1 glycosyl transferase family 1 [Desertifilum tharense IPPAS B-1220]